MFREEGERKRRKKMEESKRDKMSASLTKPPEAHILPCVDAEMRLGKRGKKGLKLHMYLIKY